MTEHERNATRSGNSERTDSIPDADEVREWRIARFDRIAAEVVAEFLSAIEALLPGFLVISVMLVDILDRFLDKRRSSLLVGTTRAVSVGIALRDAAQRQHAAEAAHRICAAAEAEQEHMIAGLIEFDQSGVAVLDIL